MGKEEDMAVALAKLVEDAENLNVQRFKCALEMKVEISWSNEQFYPRVKVKMLNTRNNNILSLFYSL